MAGANDRPREPAAAAPVNQRADASIDHADDAGSGAVFTRPRWDRKQPWWLQNEYAPVEQERFSDVLQVIGAIPPELDGVYLRNGPNPRFGDAGHWFLGAGMVHGVRLQGGKALWYRNRYVRTPGTESPPSEGGLPDPNAPLCNVSLVQHAGKLLALSEVGFPFEVSPSELSTVGKWDFQGKLTSSFTAHPRIDPANGEMLAFAYTFELPFLRYYQVDATGVLVRNEDIALPARADGWGSKVTMMHDFQITESSVVFMHMPLVLDVARALGASKLPFFWDETNGAQLGIMPRNGGSDDVIWIEVEPCYIFHTLNAYDDAAGRVILDAVRAPAPVWRDDNTVFSPTGTLCRYTIDTAARTAKLEALDERAIEFPQIDRRRGARAHRFGYALQFPQPPSEITERVQAIVKYDLTNNTSTLHEFPEWLRPDEAFFVPASSDAAEDEGYLLTYVFDRTTDRTSLFILDASNVSAPPLAEVRLPFRVPAGFHGLWVPA